MTKVPVILLALSLVGVAMSAPAHADIFKFVDDSGTVHFSNVPSDGRNMKVVKEGAGAKAERAPLKNYELAPPSAGPIAVEPLGGNVPYADIINTKCGKYGVDPKLVRSIIKAESNFNPNAVSNKGAKGLMQLMPATAADMGVSDILDPEQNIDGGVKYLKFLLDNFGGDVELSVAAYNCGQGRVIRCGNNVPQIAETKDYVKKVMRMSSNPVTGGSFSRPIYKVELSDGSIMFTDNPSPGSPSGGPGRSSGPSPRVSIVD